MDLTFVAAQRERRTFSSTGGRKLRGSKSGLREGARLEIETASIILKLPQRNRDVSVEGGSSAKVNVVSPCLLGVRGQCKQILRPYLTFPRCYQDWVLNRTAPRYRKISLMIFCAVESWLAPPYNLSVRYNLPEARQSISRLRPRSTYREKIGDGF